MKRVTYVFPQGDLGGAEIATARILRSHNRERYVPVALLFSPGPLVEHLTSLGIDVRVAQRKPRLRSSQERRSAREWIVANIRDDGAALLHSAMCWGHALAGPAARAAGIPAVWYQHNRPELTSVFDWWASLNGARTIIANSHFTARLQRRLNLRRTPIEVVYPPVEPPSTTCDRAATRAEFGFSERDVVALLPGRLQKWKGQDTAIRALALASSDAGNLHLLFAGGTLFGLEPHYKSELETLADNLGVTDQVRFLGHRDDIGALYAACDMTLHTSRDPEPYGLVVAEGRSHGCTIIASDAGAIPEQIKDGENGLLVAPNDPDALAHAMLRLTHDSELRHKLGEAAAATPGATPEQATAQLELIYDLILGF